MRHVVAVAHVGEADFSHVAKALPQGEVIGERLAGMLEIAQGIDDGNGCMLRHFCHGRVGESSQDDHVNPSLQIVGDVAHALARVQRAL